MLASKPVIFALLLSGSCSAFDPGPETWKNPTVDPAARAKALCANLTTDEKLSLLHGTGWGADVYVGVAKGVPGKGIPDLHLNDGPQGFRCNGLGKCPGGTSTQFPRCVCGG
jgi:beta-glucosidase